MKNKKRNKIQNEVKEEKLLLKDHLNAEVLKQFQEKKVAWKEEADEKARIAHEEKLAEQKEREKNKSFEELLNESNLNWKQFK